MSIENIQTTTNPVYSRRAKGPEHRRQERLERKILSICEMYKDGMTLRQIAAVHRISHEWVRQVLINQKIYEKYKYKQRQMAIGDRKIDKAGYIHIFVGVGQSGATRTGWILEHRLVMANSLGRPLRYWEIIHHKDRDKQNNTRENLEITTSAEHATCLKCPYYEFYVQQTGNTKMPFNGLDKM